MHPASRQSLPSYPQITKKMKDRIAFVDYIRVIACLLVMVVHASEQFYNMGPVSQVVNEDNRLWVSVYDGFFGRISVPLFMIVSAFLLVPMKTGMTMTQLTFQDFSFPLRWQKRNLSWKQRMKRIRSQKTPA